jgi:glycosyltransferase involved in cell wall biosynthesis
LLLIFGLKQKAPLKRCLSYIKIKIFFFNHLFYYLPMTPPVAVIIPTFNRAHLLPRAIHSVLSQTWRDFELYVVDDGSTDGTPALPIFKSPDPRLHYIRYPDNRGVSHARNFGVKQTSSHWIAFLDSDDEWLPQKLEKQIAYATTHPGIALNQTKEFWIRNGKRVNPPKTHEKSSGDLFAASLRRCMITPSSVMLKRELFQSLSGFNESLIACEDYDLWLRTTCCHETGLIDEYLLKRYGGHGDQLSLTVPVLDRFRIKSILDLLSHNCLTSDQRISAKKRLMELAAIVAEGYKKHGKPEEHEYYRKIIQSNA